MSGTPREDLVRLTHIIYGLHAFSAVMGVISSAAVVTAFLTGWPSILAVILNYARRDDVRGTYLESHFRWQIRTFWFAVLWVVVAFLLFVTILGIPHRLADRRRHRHLGALSDRARLVGAQRRPRDRGIDVSITAAAGVPAAAAE